jgi:paired amphipathic helix protein Sin3a
VERVNDPSFNLRPNATAMDLELLEAGGSTEGQEQTHHVRVTASQYYELMLETCERLFDNQIEQLAFEDQMREMFGLHARRFLLSGPLSLRLTQSDTQDAYKIFTIDKVLASLVKHVNFSRRALALKKTYLDSDGKLQVQIWEQDQKLEKIAKLLWDERRLEAPTVEDHRKFRQQTEEILGPEESLFRIDWVSASFRGFGYPTLADPPRHVAFQLPESKMLTFQLLSKDGSSLDDAEVLSGRWQAYVEGFVSETETPGVPASKVRRPFLRRCVFSTPSHSPSAFELPLILYLVRSLPKIPADGQDFYARGGLEIKVCVRTYRLFYVSRTEDVLWRVQVAAERERAAARLVLRDAGRTRWLEKLTTKGGTSETAAVVE